MPSRLINGARYAISTVLGATNAITNITNANPGVAAATVLPAADAIVLINSGWSTLNGRAVKVASPAAGNFTLAGINTVSTSEFPAGEGAGSWQLASVFVGLSKVVELNKTGGEQNFTNRQYIEDANSTQVQFPTFKSPISYEMTLDYDPDLPWFAALVAADAARQPVVLRETLLGGSIIYRAGLVTFDEEPSKDINDVMSVTATFSITGKAIRY